MFKWVTGVTVIFFALLGAFLLLRSAPEEPPEPEEAAPSVATPAPERALRYRPLPPSRPARQRPAGTPVAQVAPSRQSEPAPLPERAPAPDEPAPEDFETAPESPRAREPVPESLGVRPTTPREPGDYVWVPPSEPSPPVLEEPPHEPDFDDYESDPLEEDDPMVWSLDYEGMRAAFAEGAPDISECYREWLVAEPDLAGRVVVEFSISPGDGVDAEYGIMESLELVDSELEHAPLSYCILNVFEGFRFASPESESVTFRYPVVFAEQQAP